MLGFEPINPLNTPLLCDLILPTLSVTSRHLLRSYDLFAPGARLWLNPGCMIPLHRIDSPLHHPSWPSLLIFLSHRILPFLAGMLALGEILDEKFTWREMLCKGSNTKQYNTIHILCLYALLSSRHTRALARAHTHTDVCWSLLFAVSF